jgi:hypothetical protein
MDRHSPLWQGAPVDSAHRSPVTVQVLDVLPGLCGRQHPGRRLPLLLKLWWLRALLKLGLLPRLLILGLRLWLLIPWLRLRLLILWLCLRLLILWLRSLDLWLFLLNLRLFTLPLDLWLFLLLALGLCSARSLLFLLPLLLLALGGPNEHRHH